MVVLLSAGLMLRVLVNEVDTPQGQEKQNARDACAHGGLGDGQIRRFQQQPHHGHDDGIGHVDDDSTHGLFHQSGGHGTDQQADQQEDAEDRTH